MRDKAIPADTTLAAALVQTAIYARMLPGKRLELALRMSDSLRQVSAAGVRSRHQNYTPEQVKLAVIRLSLGEQLFRRVYPGVEIAL